MGNVPPLTREEYRAHAQQNLYAMLEGYPFRAGTTRVAGGLRDPHNGKARIGPNLEAPEAYSARTAEDDPRVFARPDGGTRCLRAGFFDEVSCPRARAILVTFATVTLRYGCADGRARINPPILLGAARASRIRVVPVDYDGLPMEGAPLAAGGRFLPPGVDRALVAGVHPPLNLVVLGTPYVARYARGTITVGY
jgi:hypothetical protein